ncbi:MAG: transposase [Actinomycetota bacterium]|nr:transposase [Actinomycetota bacterium]
MPYSRSVKVGILKKVLPPERRSITSVSDETGISEQTIRNWIKAANSGSLDEKAGEKSPRNLSSIEKYQLLMESKKIPKEELGEFLRKRGLHSQHLTLWDQEFTEMVKDNGKKEKKKVRNLQKEIKDLKKEVRRKDKALAETAALLVLKKS